MITTTAEICLTQSLPKLLLLLLHLLMQILKSPPPEWEAEHAAWQQVSRARDGLVKQYPVLVRLSEAAAAAAAVNAIRNCC
jgi:hypothetical protein